MTKFKKPDDYFKRGPIEIARFGKETIFRSNWEKEEFEKFQDALVSKLPEIRIEINALVSDVSERVRKHKPLDLLLRAYFEMMILHTNIDGEFKETKESVQSVLSLEYIQNLVAAINQDCGEKEELSNQEWADLSKSIIKLYDKIIFEYFLSESAWQRRNESISNEEDEFRYEAQMHWTNVRGERYPVHEELHLKDLLLCHSESLEQTFGITANFLISEVSKIIQSLIFGHFEAAKQLHIIGEGLSKEFEQRKKEIGTQSETKYRLERLEEYLRKNQLAGRFREAMGRVYRLDLFDLGKVTNLPNSFLELLAWKPGEDADFLADGEFKGWPLRITPISRRPF